MNYHNITKDDMLNGIGLRVVLWVSGCEHQCKDCHNKVTWNPNDGVEFSVDVKNEIFEELRKDYISGITFSGGDPLFILNVDYITNLVDEIKFNYPQKNIWLYTGYLWEEVKHLPLIKYIDVLVDGKFDKELEDINYHWAGSTNQRVIDVKKSLEKNKLVVLN